ncbi:MAG: ParB/RepB/Spo0J family partition protein [Bryobacteraceae bacterium]
MTDTTSIPLNKLVAWNGNVRKTAGADTALAELAASIAAHGLINPLTVRPCNGEKFEVGAGGRRFAALQLLLKQGKIPADHPVRCEVRSKDDNFLEISLAENFAREDMHPADEFEAFRALIDKGMPASDVAARFGVTEAVVIKRMKLARVSPLILQAYRDDKISLECVMAFAVTDDHKRQERFWKTAQASQKTDARAIRRALTEGEIDASDRRVRFVTLKAYEEAGGTVRRDLFTDGDNGTFITKPDLLNQLVADLIDRKTQSLLKDGWKWVQFAPENGYETRNRCKRLESTDGPLPAKLQAEYAKITAEHKKLEAKKSPSVDDEQRYSDLEDRIFELDAKRPDVYTPEQMAIGGVFLELQHDGKLDIMPGYVKPEDVKTLKAQAKADSKDGKPKPAAKASLSQSLEADLAAHRTAAVSALLLDDPGISLSAIVHSLGMRVFYSNPFGRSLEFDFTGPRYPQDFRKSGDARGIEAVEKSRETWKKRLPGKQDQFWQWCRDADQKTLLSLLAFFAALSGNNADKLAGELSLDMEDFFTPTAVNFFSRIGKPEIVKAIKEATGKGVAPATEKLKRSELALFAERAVKGTGWLPKILRSDKAAKKPQKRAA